MPDLALCRNEKCASRYSCIRYMAAEGAHQVYVSKNEPVLTCGLFDNVDNHTMQLRSVTNEGDAQTQKEVYEQETK